MSEDARGAKGRTRVLYVANPGSDSDGSEDDGRRNPTAHSVYGHTPLRPNRLPPNSHVSYHNPPAPLTTNLPLNHTLHHPSSHPSVSSPSSINSPAGEESTPPPITSSLSAPFTDLSGDNISSHEHVVDVNSNDRNMVDSSQIATSRKGKLLQTIKSPFHNRNSRPIMDGSQKRPRTSPIVSTQDSYTNLSSAVTSGKVLIVVTTDSDWYVTVDISGAKNAVMVREYIFNKLNIQDDDQLHFSIYQTEMGAYAIGDALTDERLFSLCRDHGDSKGSLKFFVSHSSAPVHEHPLRPHSPIATTVPPPVLPYNDNPAPLRPKRRSRQESVSSTSEQHPLETAAGYEADIDNPDRDTFKPTHSHSSHPLPSPPQQPIAPLSSSGNPPSSPRTLRRQPPRPISPLLRPPNSDAPPLPPDPSRADRGVPDSKQHMSPPPPPPLSPNRPNFVPDENVTALSANRGMHDRSSSDAGAEREHALKTAEQQYESATKQWRSRQPHAMGDRLKTEPSLESISSQKEARRKRHLNDSDDHIGRSDSWVLVPSSNTRSNEQEFLPQELHRLTAQSSRNALRQQPSPRVKVTSPYTGRSLAIPNAPRQPPPAVPQASNDTRPPPRPAGVPISSKFFVAWRGEARGEQKPMPTSSSQWPRLSKGTKSMDNLRAVFNHPATLQPGVARRPPQLPMTRPPVNTREHMPFPSSSPVLPKSYEPPRQVRPLPMQGPTHSSNLDFGQNMYGMRGTLYPGGLMSPNHDPYPRPVSAFGDSMTSPTNRHQRQVQSPTHGSTDSNESIRAPRSSSPSRSYHATRLSGSRLENTHGSRSDRSSDVHSAAESSCTTSPHTPISPKSPLYPSREREKNTGLSRPSMSNISDNTSNGISDNRGSESTLRQEQRTWFSTFVGQGTEATLIPPRIEESNKDVRTQTPPPITSSEISQSSFDSHSEDSDGDDFGTSMWKKRPMAESHRPKSNLRPPLKVQIEPSNGSTQLSQHSTSITPRRPPTPPRPQRRTPSQGDRGPRVSTFTDRQSSTWAPRPPPEDVYERLEEFFPEHDLDKPVIEANSGGTSPTTTELAAIPVPPIPAPEKTRIRGKKSIRIVAQEHKKLIDRTSRADPSCYSNVMRKRSTKLWGSKLEEVTTAQAKSQPVPPMPESPPGGPTTFKWVRGELIGRGTYGRVYLALNATTGEMIAVKQVETPRTASDKNDSRQISVVQALKMESETLKDLDHPNIVQYLGFEETPSNLSIFLEYVPGGSIGSCLLKNGKFDEEVTKSFTGQILSGLEYLHSKGILHRDLKADNILVEMTGVCKISDFGISKRTDDGSGGAFTAMQGTVFWMAPEVIQTQKKGYNFKIDIWSVGCVVLEMWAGMRPWMGEEMVAVMFKVYHSKLPPPVPEDVVLSDLADDFRRKCFAINPEERPTAAELRKHPYLILPPDWVFTDFK